MAEREVREFEMVDLFWGFIWRRAWQVDEGGEDTKTNYYQDEVSAWDVCVEMKMKHACGGGHHGGPAPAV
jgi:hypothetical protein